MEQLAQRQVRHDTGLFPKRRTSSLTTPTAIPPRCRVSRIPTGPSPNVAGSAAAAPPRSLSHHRLREAPGRARSTAEGRRGRRPHRVTTGMGGASAEQPTTRGAVAARRPAESVAAQRGGGRVAQPLAGLVQKLKLGIPIALARLP